MLSSTRFVATVAIVAALASIASANPTQDPDRSYGGSFSIHCISKQDISGGAIGFAGGDSDSRAFSCQSLKKDVNGANGGFLTCAGKYTFNPLADTGVALAYHFLNPIDGASYLVFRIFQNGSTKVVLSTDSLGESPVTPIVTRAGPGSTTDKSGSGGIAGMVGITTSNIVCRAHMEPFFVEVPLG
eukprot:Opistho-2@642